MKVVSVVGARPNFVKIAPIIEAMKDIGLIETVLVHTGQHYDYLMSRAFFEDLAIPEPDFHLGIGAGTHAEQTAKVMVQFEQVLEPTKCDFVLVVGDTNSTMAAALTAVKLGIPVVHVEAGLRSFDRSMPEEINRLVTDAIADHLFTPSTDADDNLQREGVPAEKIHFVGNVMIDTLLKYQAAARDRDAATHVGLTPKDYAVLTLHRPSNVDSRDTFSRIIDAVEAVQREIPVVFPVHPRARYQIDALALEERLAALTGLRLIEPLGYLDFLSLQMDARFVMTDSGGIQEETTVLDVPCLTLRGRTERPVTVTVGTNEVVGTNADCIRESVRAILGNRWKRGRVPPRWDGKASERITGVLLSLSDQGRRTVVHS